MKKIKLEILGLSSSVDSQSGSFALVLKETNSFFHSLVLATAAWISTNPTLKSLPKLGVTWASRENPKKKETTVGNNNRLQKKQLNIAQTSFIED